MMYDNPDLHALWRAPTANVCIRWGDVFREETCSRTSLTAMLTRAGYRLPLDHQFSGAVDINETGFAY